jgi:hypothetical protein
MQVGTIEFDDRNRGNAGAIFVGISDAEFKRKLLAALKDPEVRAALFGPPADEDREMSIEETIAFCQGFSRRVTQNLEAIRRLKSE